MPQIKGYEAPELGLRPSEAGVEATAQAANRIGRFYNQAGAAVTEGGNQFARQLGGAVKDAGDVAVDYAQHQEINHGAATYAQLNDDLTQKWNDIAKKADPNDPTVAAKFNEQVLEPALDQYRQGFLTEGGQKFAETHIEGLRNHMFQKTAADMSSLAADAVAVNVRQTANSLSNTAMTDPSSVDHLLNTSDSLVGGMVDSSPNLKGAPASKARMELTEKMKENIVKSGAIGAIQQAADPEAEALKWGAKYPQYISGEELRTLSGNARQQLRARNYDFELNRRRDKEAAIDKSNEKADQYLIDIRSRDPRSANDPLSTNIVNDKELLRADKTRLLGYVDRQLKPETDARLSSETFTGLLRNLRDPNADPDKVMQQAWDARLKDPGLKGSMSEKDFNAFRSEVIDRKTPDGLAISHDRDEFFKRYAGNIDGYLNQTGMHSALGSQKMYEAEQEARKQERVLKQGGKDPSSLYDPSSPNFFGRPENLRRFQVSFQEADKYSREGGPNSKNIGTVTGVAVQDIPPGMSPAEAMKKFKPGTRVKLPDGSTGVVPGG